MNQTAVLQSNEDEEPPHQHLRTTFTSMLTLFPDISRNARENTISQPNERQVTSKMRNKLLTWIEKLSTETFKFDHSTFITAALILDQYLQKVDQSPSKLQLVSCASLFISSKLKEPVIVAPECYVTACCQIYTKKELLQKQRVIYSQISFKKIRQSVVRKLQKGCLVIKLEKKIQEGMKILGVFVKKEKFNEWNEGKVVCAVLSLLICNKDLNKTNKFLEQMQNWL